MQNASWPSKDKGDAPLPLITPWARHAFIPRGKPRGMNAKNFDKSRCRHEMDNQG
jgi:hypothetical protein